MKAKYRIYDTKQITPTEKRFHIINIEIDLPYEIVKFLKIVQKILDENPSNKEEIKSVFLYFLNQKEDANFSDFKSLAIILKMADNELSNDERKFIIDYILKKNNCIVKKPNCTIYDFKDILNYKFKYCSNDEIIENLETGEIERIMHKDIELKNKLSIKEKKLYVDMLEFLHDTRLKYQKIYTNIESLYLNCQSTQLYDIQLILDNLMKLGFDDYLCEIIKNFLEKENLKVENRVKNKAIKESKKIEQQSKIASQSEKENKQSDKQTNAEPKVSLREKKKIYYNLQRLFDFDNMEARTYLTIDTQIECIKDLNKIGLSHLVEDFFQIMYDYNKDLIECDKNIILKIINCDNILTYLQDLINLGLDKYISLLEPFFTKAYERLREKEPITYYQIMYNKVLYYKEKYNIDMKSIEDSMKKMIMPKNESEYIEAKEFVELFVNALPAVLNNDITYEKEKALELISKD